MITFARAMDRRSETFGATTASRSSLRVAKISSQLCCASWLSRLRRGGDLLKRRDLHSDWQVPTVRPVVGAVSGEGKCFIGADSKISGCGIPPIGDQHSTS